MAKIIAPFGSTAPKYDHGGGVYRSYPPSTTGGNKRLTLLLANSGNSDYSYLPLSANYLGCFAFPSPLNDNGWNYNEYQQSNIILSPTPGRAIVSARSTNGDDSRRIAEIQIPSLYTGSNRSSIPNATVTRALFDAVSAAPVDNGVWAGGCRLSGGIVHNGRLILQAYGNYDMGGGGAGSVTQTSMVINDAANIGPAGARGWFRLVRHPGDNLGARVAGWVSEIPAAWQSALGGTHLFGFSSGNIRSANSRHSIGPSLFVANLNASDSITGSNPPSNGAEVVVTEKMNFPLGESTSLTPQSLLSNGGQIWTNLSEAYYGFIVPGTRTYMVIGYSAGHNGSGLTIGYQGTYYPFTSTNMDQTYWLFDLDEIADNGIAPHLKRPYESGPFALRWQGTLNNILYRTVRGGAYDVANKLLYITTSRNDANSESALCEVYNFAGVAN